MSFNVLVIPEDLTKDEHILKPLVERILEDCGRKPQVQVCRNPNFQGVQAALNLDALREVVALYPMVSLFILFIGRDGRVGRKQRTDHIENTRPQSCGPKRAAFLRKSRGKKWESSSLRG